LSLRPVCVQLLNFYPALWCKNNLCSHQIQLPGAIQAESSPSQTPWPLGAQQRNFLCLSCNHGFAYSAEDCHWFPVLQQEDQTDRTALVVQMMWLECGNEPSGDNVPYPRADPKIIPCPHCSGTGKLPVKIKSTSPLHQHNDDCPSCDGTGKRTVE